MIRNWTLHLKTDEEKERFNREVLSARGVLERLTQILNSEEDMIHKKERSSEVYTLPNWAERQAHYNGYLNALNDIKFIINLDHKDDGQSIRTGQRPAQPQPPRRTDEQVERQTTSGTSGS